MTTMEPPRILLIGCTGQVGWELMRTLAGATVVDGVVASPALDLALWMVRLQERGYKGPMAELGFFFKKPEGVNPPYTFVEQIQALQRLAENGRD